MIKIKRNPYRKSDITPEDAYKLGETLELIYQLEAPPYTILSSKIISRLSNVKNYIDKLESNLSNDSKNIFNQGRKNGKKQILEIFDVLNKKQLKNYQESLIEEVEELKYKNNL